MKVYHSSHVDNFDREYCVHQSSHGFNRKCFLILLGGCTQARNC